jgi:pimeloyl-ACP methyl ester carboxylesterase
LLSRKKATYQKKSVTSKDGTTIGFRQFGRGPGVVILHGGALASQHYMKLGAALADEFTVCIPDRRGRGMSGPYGRHYSIEREDEDLDAIVTNTAAQYVFGEADGGLFALHGSLKIPAIRKVAVFEPVLFVGQPGLDEFEEVINRSDLRLTSGDLAAVMGGSDERVARLPGRITRGTVSPAGLGTGAAGLLQVVAVGGRPTRQRRRCCAARFDSRTETGTGSGQGHRGNYR